MKNIEYGALAIFCMCLFIVGFQFKHQSTPVFTDDNCIQALVGEYSKNDYWGLKMMAHAIRNRDTLKGVYGFYAPHVKRESKSTWLNATTAWFQSEEDVLDPTNGATEWRSFDDYKKYGHPKGFILTKIYDGTFFYKPALRAKKKG